MRRVTFIALSAIFLLSGCSAEQRLERKEDRLIGAWTFDKAFYKEDGALFRDNVIRDFEGDIIEFYSDYSCVYDDFSLRYAFWGDWLMHYDRDFYDDEPDVDFFLDMTFFDGGRVSFSYFSSVTLLTNNRLHLRVHDRRGIYTFKLRRI